MIDLDKLYQNDIALLERMIRRHHQYTQSAVAGFILNDYENQLRHFIKVFPKDYKRILIPEVVEKAEG